MAKSTTSEMMGHADDLFYQMRKLSNSGNLIGAVELMHKMHSLIQDISGVDRQQEDDESTMALSYILDIQSLMTDHLQGIPSGSARKAA